MNALYPEDIRRIINEERQLHELRLRVDAFLINEEKRLLSLGYTQDQVNEGIMNFLGSFGTEFLKGYKNKFARWLIANIGLDPNSFIAQTVGNLIEETPVKVIWGWVRGKGGGCEDFGMRLADAVLESIEEKLLNPLMGKIGFRNVAAGSIGGTFREQFQTWLKSTKIRKDMQRMMVTTVCEFEMGSVLGIGSGWNRKGGDSPDSSDASSEMMSSIEMSADVQDALGTTGKDNMAVRTVDTVKSGLSGALDRISPETR